MKQKIINLFSKVKRKFSKGKLAPETLNSMPLDEAVNQKKDYLTRVNSMDILCDKNYFHFFELMAYVFVISICILGFVIMSLSTSRPDVKFFSTNDQGQVKAFKSAGNDGNPISNGSVQQFFLEAIPNSFTFDFNDYDYVFSKNLPKYFTPR
jgi:hypothetical protein